MTFNVRICQSLFLSVSLLFLHHADPVCEIQILSIIWHTGSWNAQNLFNSVYFEHVSFWWISISITFLAHISNLRIEKVQSAFGTYFMSMNSVTFEWRPRPTETRGSWSCFHGHPSLLSQSTTCTDQVLLVIPAITSTKFFQSFDNKYRVPSVICEQLPSPLSHSTKSTKSVIREKTQALLFIWQQYWTCFRWATRQDSLRKSDDAGADFFCFIIFSADTNKCLSQWSCSWVKYQYSTEYHCAQAHHRTPIGASKSCT